MNNLLYLKGQFQQRKGQRPNGAQTLPKDGVVYTEHLRQLCEELRQIQDFWKNNTIIGGALISVHYKYIVAKSNRLKGILSKGSASPNSFIRGAKFVWDNGKQKHVFTYFVSMDILQNSIDNLEKLIKIVDKSYCGKINSDELGRINNGEFADGDIIPKTTFAKYVVDAYYTEFFNIDRVTDDYSEDTIVTIYKTGISTISLLKSFGIDMIEAKMIDETTIRLTPIELNILKNKAPYLIAMGVKDFSEIVLEDIADSRNEGIISIPSPTNEPIIGVLDTQFDDSVYFHEWVDYNNMLSEDIEIHPEDRRHGTEIDSIIVDGPAANPDLDDGCGRFRVRHFGIGTASKMSSFTALKLIRDIISKNQDIKVWNLSLGSVLEIDPNFISPEAAEIDRIQNEYDVIFVIAGTNKGNSTKNKMRIGAPADSLNALVVNSVDRDNEPVPYSRCGPVLSFFNKPDVSYYGGDNKHKICVCEPLGAAYVMGTSFAAPWIARKIAYLIYRMNLSRETAKALIIDGAAGWNRRDDSSHLVGYGTVPTRIEDIVYSQNDEIRFIMTGVIDEYESYTYNLPIPQNKGSHPFFARATLVYFPKSKRNQGVDYTMTEMDIHFGRVKESVDKKGNRKTAIVSINGNKQGDSGDITIYEEDARKMYRKWDNIKHISEKINPKARPKQAYESGMWGLSIKTKERINTRNGKGLNFGVVVTLKEMNGVNRIDEFVKLCMMRGWIVNRLDVSVQNEIYIASEEEIDFE